MLLLSCAISLALAFTVPLLDPDEGRNAEIAREMSVDGDLVIPHLAGMPYLDKPPALFWAAAAVIRWFGPTRWAPRLPSTLAAVLTLLALASLARRIDGGSLAWRSAALLAASPLFAVLGAYVIFDMLVTLCVTLAWTLLARELAEGPSPWRRVAMFSSLALGVLTKGPVMLIWCLGGSVATALLMRRRAPLAWLAWWPGWAIFLATAGGWFVAACIRHPEYPHYAFVEESVERMTTTNFHRNQAWWFTIATIVCGALPWSLATPWHAMRARWAAAREGGSSALASAALSTALGFVLFAFVFFTLSRSNLVTYVLPAIPALALLAAIAWSTVHSRGRLVFPLLLAVTPALLVFGGRRLRAEATKSSGEPLARAISAWGSANGRVPAVRYDHCYSPGTDFLLGRRAVLVSPRADQTTSVYQARYRSSLRRRGLWTSLDESSQAPAADVIVWPAWDVGATGAGLVEIFHDTRFAAYARMTPR